MPNNDLNELNQVLAKRAIENLEESIKWLRELTDANVESYRKTPSQPGEAASREGIEATLKIQESAGLAK